MARRGQHSLDIWELGWEQVEVGKRGMSGDGKDFALGMAYDAVYRECFVELYT